MSLESPNPSGTYGLILKDIERIKDKQGERPCETHTVEIKGLIKSDDEQWIAINQLRKTVWGWAGAIALGGFGGSILGTLAIRYFVK